MLYICESYTPVNQSKLKMKFIEQLGKAFEIFGSLDPGALPLHHAQIYLFIAEEGSTTYREIEEKFELSNASASRVVNSLSSKARHRQTSLGLCEIYQDPKEGRRNRVKLSKKGKYLYKQIESI